MPPDEVRIRHLIDAATKAVAFARGKVRSDLDDDEMLRLALNLDVLWSTVTEDIPALLTMIPDLQSEDRPPPV